MYFKKALGKIFGVQFTKAEQRALDEAIGKQIVENDKQFSIDNDSSILWMLHEQFGFGPVRLKRAWKSFYVENKKLRARYEMGAQDGGWLCRQKLLGIGCDVEQWYREEESDNESNVEG